MPSVKILGDREVHANSGSSVTVRCLISNVLSAPSYVFWYEKKNDLNFCEFSSLKRGWIFDKVHACTLNGLQESNASLKEMYEMMQNSQVMLVLACSGITATSGYSMRGTPCPS